VKGFQIIVSQVGQRRMNVHMHQDVVNNAIIIRQCARVQDFVRWLVQGTSSEANSVSHLEH